MKSDTYIHNKIVHNVSSASEILPFIFDLFNPKTIIDVGCGTGTWLHVSQELGAERILGIDGEYLKKEDLIIEERNFLSMNLSDPDLSLDKKRFDLVISLEVAEHLPKESSDNFIKFLTNMGDIIIFSAAIPNQGGQNHLNEQWPLYWKEKFEKLGYSFYDIFRLKFWDNPKVDWWYKQNMFLVAKNNVHTLPFNSEKNILNLIHPELYDYRVSLLKKIKNKYNLKSTIYDHIAFDDFSIKDALKILASVTRNILKK